MNSDFDYNGFPASFAHCFNGECSRGATCLRRQVALRIPQDRACVYAIKSQMMSYLGRTNYYRCNRKERLIKPISNNCSAISTSTTSRSLMNTWITTI